MLNKYPADSIKQSELYKFFCIDPQELKNLPTLEIDCPDCNGKGYVCLNPYEDRLNEPPVHEQCHCNNGKIKVIKASDIIGDNK